MKKVSFQILDCGHYPYDVLLTVGTTEEQVVAYLKRRCGYEATEQDREAIHFHGVRGRAVHFQNNAFLIWLKAPDVAVAAHEVFHVVEMLMGKVLFSTLSDATSEPYAYLLEHLMKQALRSLKV